MTFAPTPLPPYYAVIFTSLRTEGDNGYGEMAEAMIHLAAQQPGFLGIESAREDLASPSPTGKAWMPSPPGSVTLIISPLSARAAPAGIRATRCA